MNKHEINKLTISEFSFESFSIKKTYLLYNRKPNKELNLSISSKGKIDKQLNCFFLEMQVLIDDSENNFEAEIIIVGVFSFKENINKDILDNYFYLNAPAILFPFIRSYIYTLTSHSGIGTITLPIMNLSSVIDLKENTIEL